MKPVFFGEVYEVLTQPNGIIFSYCSETTEDHVVVSYKMVSFDTGRMTDVTKNIYQLSKFGSNYRAVTSLCCNYVTAHAIPLTNGKVFMVEEDGKAMLFNTDGMPVWTGEMKYHGNAPADIAVYKNTLWACYAQNNVLLRYNLNTMREELRIGGERSPFREPHHLFIDGDEAIVSNTGSNQLIRVDLNHYTVREEKTFEEPVYGFVQVKDYAFALLPSGLYYL